MTLFESGDLPEQRKPFLPRVALSENDFRSTEDDVPRIVDWRLAQVLSVGYEPELRRSSERHREHLEKLGTLWSRSIKSTGGRPATEYRYNFEQAMYLVVVSRQHGWQSVLVHIVQIYGMWARGEHVARDVEAANKAIDSIAKAAETAPALIKVLRHIGQEHPFGYDPEEDN